MNVKKTDAQRKATRENDLKDLTLEITDLLMARYDFETLLEGSSAWDIFSALRAVKFSLLATMVRGNLEAFKGLTAVLDERDEETIKHLTKVMTRDAAFAEAIKGAIVQ